MTSNGKTVGVKVHCTGTAGTSTPGTSPADGIYGPYGTGTPGSVTAAGGCEGSIRLRGKIGRKKAQIGQAVFSLARGQTKAIPVKLSVKTRRALRSLRKLKARVSISSPAAVSAPRRLTIKPVQKKTPAK